MASDRRYITVDGRRWRRADPGLDEPVRQVLVDELMAARRAVGAALRRGDRAAERAARSRVQRAKVALGERGTPWWERTEAERDAAVQDCLDHRPPD